MYLANELWASIFGFLGVKDLEALALVCFNFNGIINTLVQRRLNKIKPILSRYQGQLPSRLDNLEAMVVALTYQEYIKPYSDIKVIWNGYVSLSHVHGKYFWLQSNGKLY